MDKLIGSGVRGVSRRAFLGGATLSGAGVLLAACGLQAGPTGESGDMQKADAPAKEEAKTSMSEGAVAVLLWQWGTTYVPGFDTLVADYNQIQEEVALTVEQPSGYWDSVLAAIAAQTGPDIFLMNGVNIKSWATGGRVVADLSQYIASDKQATDDLAVALPSFVEWYSQDGKATGTPWNYSTSNTQYNVDHVVAAGLTPPAELGDGWDWNALQEYAEKLTQRDGENITRFGSGHLHGIETGWGNFIQMNGGSVLNEDRSRCVIASPEAVDAVQFCVDMVQKHRVAPTRDEYTALRGENRLHPSAFLISGVVSVFSAGDWYFNRYKDHPDLKWDVTFLAKSPSTGETGNNSNFRGTVMNPVTENPDAAWKWMAHSLTKPVQDRIVELFNEVPARLDSALEYYTSTEKSGPPPSRAMLEDSLRATISLPTHDVVTWQQMIREGVNPSMNPIFNNEIGVAEGLRQMQDQINAQFDAAAS